VRSLSGVTVDAPAARAEACAVNAKYTDAWALAQARPGKEADGVCPVDAFNAPAVTP
jgi:hypothetical protein